jgi:hypothetical protein
VITKLGDVESINPKIIENLFASDLSYLQEFYNNVNGNGTPKIRTSCPKCDHQFEAEFELSGEYQATPSAEFTRR